MKSVNKVTILGNITKDPELKYTPSGVAVTNMSVATNRAYKAKGSEEWTEVAEFHNIVLFGKTAELIDQLCSKGNRIYLEGRLQTRSWEGKDGVKRYTTEIVAEDFVLLTPKLKEETEVKPPIQEPVGEKDTAKLAEEIFGNPDSPTDTATEGTAPTGEVLVEVTDKPLEMTTGVVEPEFTAENLADDAVGKGNL
jgi:single-strand DNA-binding protein